MNTNNSEKSPKTLEMEAKAQKMRVKWVDLKDLDIESEYVQLIPLEMAKRNRLVCIGKTEKNIIVAMADPLDVFAIDELKMRAGYDIEAVLADPEDLEKKISQLYGEDTSWKDRLAMDFSEAGMDIISEDQIAEDEVVIDQPIITAVNKIITQAVERRASDIHIEPFEDSLLVRYRMDGVLHEIMTFPPSVQPALISRVKIMASLDIAEKRSPQDGRIHLRIRGKDYDFRVSSLPTLHGESIVMRILDKGNLKVELKMLGFSQRDHDRFTELIHKPNGILLVTGPTGSGKSTTLYASLNTINTPDTKILTVEDPVEYNLKGIIQVQTNNRAGLTFATALRSFLRQDPDIIMVGEIRDRETATIAIESALTGHMVLSTLHTNNAVGAITRLVDMGVEHFLIASTMNGALAQRLVRVICEKCKEPITPPKKLLDSFNKFNIPTDNLNVCKGVGCPACNKTGYKGRKGIYELLVVSDKFREMVVEGASSHQLDEQARKDGLLSLYEDGLLKVAEGITSYEELLRVTQD